MLAAMHFKVEPAAMVLKVRTISPCFFAGHHDTRFCSLLQLGFSFLFF
jgi:hypothetical protein